MSSHAASLFHTYNETFEECFPYYLAIGMTFDQYWNGDCTLTIAYRKADELRRNRKNEELWLQGLYIYEALCDVSPVLHAFAKKGVKPQEYANKPYPITEKQLRDERIAKEKARMEKGKRYMETMLNKIHKERS